MANNFVFLKDLSKFCIIMAIGAIEPNHNPIKPIILAICLITKHCQPYNTYILKPELFITVDLA